MRGSIIAAAIAVAAVPCPRAAAQRPAHFEHRTVDLVHARELFNMAKYGAAQHELESVAARITDPYDGTRTEAEFLSALCAVRLYHNDASHRLLAFIDRHPESQHVEACELELFRHYFQQKRWDDALAWSGKVDLHGLNTTDQEEFRFKRGYANFQNGAQEKALGDFDAVQKGTGTYAPSATYYAAHINYERGNYETALQGFNKLKTDESFGRVVPFYIAELLFLQGNYEELQEYVKPLLNDPNGAKRVEEINRLAGEAYYRTGKYAEALPHLEKSAQRTGVQRGDRYVLGYAQYRTGDHKKALEQFNLVAQGDDSLAQMAAYHMADCYLKLNEKTYARNAFKRAYEMGKDPKVTEDALFNYAKLSYELSFDPYHEAIIALRNYLKQYPNSPRYDEAQGFLLDVFIKTRNYEDALATLDAIKTKTLPLQAAYQKLAFDRGVELYTGRKYQDAALFFEKALKYPVDPEANAKAHYWMGESYYEQDDFGAALRKYDDLRNSKGAFATDLYEQASYSMGYCWFKQKEWGEASTAFRRFAAATDAPREQRNDAMVRTADCAFMLKDEATAIQWYDKAITANAADKDYAQFQKGVCLGLEQKFPEKIAALKKLLDNSPNSRFAADAKFHLGETHLNLDQDAQALGYYQEVVNGHANSPHVHKSMLQIALIHKRQGKTEQALEEYKAVVTKYPTADGARDALAAIEAIYVEQGRVGEYEAYVRTLGAFVDPATLDFDEKYYRSAEKLYFDEKCDQAIGAFGDYLAKYPNGGFALNAHFYKGDCEYRAGRYADALADLEEVIERNGTQFMESAVKGAAEILHREKRWEGALDRFDQLEGLSSTPENTLLAQVGRMRCLKELGRAEDAARAAEKVAANSNATADQKAEAGIAIANGLLAADDLDGAFARFKGVANSSRNAIGAEAKYHCAYVKHLQKKYRDAEKEIFELAQKFPTYDHWKAKGFILLGDVYLQLDDRFQAKVTLQSVVDNCKEPDLVAEAQRRLDAINASEVRQNTPAPQDSLEITLPGGDQ